MFSEAFEETLNSLLGGLHEQVWVLNQDLEIVWANPAVKNTHGKSLVGEKCYQAFHSQNERCEKPYCGACRCLASGREQNFETRLDKNEQQKQWLHFKSRIVSFPDQISKELVLTTGSDVTPRKKAFKALCESEMLCQAILANISEAVFVTDDNGDIAFASSSAAKTFGLNSEAVLEKENIFSLLGIDPEELTGREKFIDIEVPVFFSNGEERWLLVNSKQVPLKFGTVLYTCRDITQCKRMDQELKAVERMKIDFIAMAGHELRTPLTAVQGFAELLYSHPQIEQASRQRYIFLIFQKARELSNIVDNLLLCASQERSRRQICHHKRMVDVKVMIERLVQKAQRKTLRHRFVVHLPENSPQLFLDETKMEMAIEHLLDNAAKYSPEGGQITVAGLEQAGELLFLVEDEGIGMTPEQKARVFDKGYRVDSSNTAPSGLGLGMSVVRRIIEEHGGRIWLTSAPEQGTRVFFTIPICNRKKLFDANYHNKRAKEC